MDGFRGTGGSYSKKLGASSYLLELVPDIQQTSESLRQRAHLDGFPSQYQLSTRPEDAATGSRQEMFTASQSLQWGGRDSIRDRDDLTQRFSPAVMTKCRLSRSKKRAPPEPSLDATPTKDHVIFAESPVAPGVPVVYRPPEDRVANPDRLNLDRRHLTVCPILEGEDRLRLLNLQHNAITRLQNLSNLRRLVFLDLYDNLIHEISGLEGLLSLRVLMLGKNRIRKISGLQTLLKLDVLDLHGNMIRYIESLSHLTHLRVLNLAGNDITCVSNLAGLQALAELNLRRNRITHVYEIDELLNLQRLFLSHNLIQSYDDVGCLSQCDTLSELTLDGNPLANAPDHRPSIIYHISHLRVLDQAQVTEEERGEALAAAREEQERLKEVRKLAQQQEHKQSAVLAIRRAWETSHRHLLSNSLAFSTSTQSFVGKVDLIKQSRLNLLRSSSLPQLLPTYFVDLNGPCLHLYGEGALETFDTPSHGSNVEEIQFHYIEFEDIAALLPKMSRGFPLVRSLTFECTNMTGLEQLNALALLTTPLHTLTITAHGNPITHHPFYKPYLLYRLGHLGVTVVSGEGVEDEGLLLAEQLFGKLGQLTTSQLSHGRLLGLISKHRPTPSKRAALPAGSLTVAKRSTPITLCQEPLNRVSLHHYSSQSQPLDTAQQIRQSTAETFCADLVSATLKVHQKLDSFDKLWPRVMGKLVHRTLREFSNIDNNMKSLLENL